MQLDSGETLIARAEVDSGLDDWGPGIFREVLELLIEDVRVSRPIDHGTKAFQHRVARILRNRLLLVEDRKRDHMIAAQAISAPIFVIGLPRTGTTFLHSLLAQDPASRSPAEWEATRPSPSPRAADYLTDPRIALSRSEIPADPETLKRHIQDAQLPVECGPAALTYEFLSSGFDIRWNTPRLRHRMTSPIPTAYAWHLLVLQHLQVHTRQERWVLKSPEHIAHLPELFNTYPDARIVFTHRNPAKVFPSLASLTAHMQLENLGQRDRRKVGEEVFNMWHQQLSQALSFRASGVRSDAFIDITQDQISADPMKVIERIYDHFNILLSRIAEKRMLTWLDSYGQDSYRDSHGAHHYSAQEYGFDEETLMTTFRDYTTQFLEQE